MNEKQTTFNLFDEDVLGMTESSLNSSFLEDIDDFEIKTDELKKEQPVAPSTSNNNPESSYDFFNSSTSNLNNEYREEPTASPFMVKAKPVPEQVEKTIQELDSVKEINIIKNEVNDNVQKIDLSLEQTDNLVSASNFGKVKIIAIGVGGCGCNTIDRMYNEKIGDIKLIAMDTSIQHLDKISADEKILIGESFFKGHGSGNDLAAVEDVFQAEKTKIQDLLEGVDMLFVTGGIGRGTGSVGLAEIGKLARQMDILTIGFATLPRNTEANPQVVKKYYNEFVENVDSNVTVETQRVFEVAKHLPIIKAMRIADKMLVDGIKGISELITSPGKINLDYADVRTAFANKGSCIMGVGYGRGENAVVDAIEEALLSEIVNFENIKNANVIVFNITCAKNSVTIRQATSGTDLIYEYNTENNIEHLLFGYSYDNTLGEEVKVTFIATGTQAKEFNYKSASDSFTEVRPRTISVDQPRVIRPAAEKKIEIPDFLNKK